MNSFLLSISTAIPYLLCLLSYFVGGIPWGFIVGRLRGVDIRKLGSGNIGATNVLRSLGTAAGITVLILDMLKGYGMVVLAGYLLRDNGFRDWWVVAVGLMAVLGHTYTPFLHFNGGKGVATSLGVIIGLNGLIALVAIAVFIVVVAISRYVSLGSIVGSVVAAVLFWVMPSPPPYRLFVLMAAVFVTIRHRKNIERLRAGTENRIGKSVPAPRSDDPPRV